MQDYIPYGEEWKKSIKNMYDKLKHNFCKLLEVVKNDDAIGASFMLQRYRDRLEGLSYISHFCLEEELIDIYEYDLLKDYEKEIRDEIKTRLQDRIFWMATLIEKSIEARKETGKYNGEFTTGVILANAFNDILGNDFEGLFRG